MPFNRTPLSIKQFATALLLFAGAYATATDISTTPLSTYAVTSAKDVKPNVMFVLDDSGSMDWDYMPDWANDNSPPDYRFNNRSFNGLAYNPAVTYTPPVSVNSAGVANTTSYLNMTGAGSTTGGSNWSAVKNDAYGVQSTSTTNLTPSATQAPYFYTTVPGEYCSSTSLRNCISATAPTTVGGVTYNFPAMLRWCTTSGLTTCKAGYDSGTYANPRMPSPRTATITVASGTFNVTGLTVGSGGLQIMSASSGSSSGSTLAQNIANQINACTYGIPTGSNCTTVGFTATSNNSTVTITAPSATSATPVLTPSNAGTAAGAFSIGSVPGENLRTTITPSVTTYNYSGTTRTDCSISGSNTTCTYAQEMTNYANWWTYYRTRMQMMKTAASNAFSTLDTTADRAIPQSKYRVGFMSINNNTGSDFVNLGEFTGIQMGTWYSKLTKAKPNNSTPLRTALSKVGRLYGGKFNGLTLNGTTVTEPLQYSCQRNYTILSTDGFWNEAEPGGYKLDGRTAVGNQDGGLSAPYGDGGTSSTQIRTSTLQISTAPLINQISTSKLQIAKAPTINQSSTSTLQISTAPVTNQQSTLNLQTSKATITNQRNTGTLQTRTRANSNATWGQWSNVANNISCTANGTTVDCQYSWTGFSNTGSNGSNSCTEILPSTGPTYTVRTARQCQQTTIWSSFTNTNNTCTVDTSTNCQYESSWSAFSNTGSNGSNSCTELPPSTSSPYTVTTARKCQQTVGTFSSFQNTNSTCTPDIGTQCQYSAWSTFANTGNNGTNTCTKTPQSTTAPFTVTTATDCKTISGSFPPNPTYADATGTCTPDSTTLCQYTAWSSFVNTASSGSASCSKVDQSGAAPYTVLNAARCQTAPGTFSTPVNASADCTTSTTTRCTYSAWTAWADGACTAAAQSTGPTFTQKIAAQCQAGTSSGGTSNTLADVAAYYYNTDLRTATPANTADTTGTCTSPAGDDLCANNISSSGRDVATTQHMTTYTLGLGAQGKMIYAPEKDKDYWKDTSGDFYAIANGKTTAGVDNSICSWQTSGTCYWPTPAPDSNANIDDLWHAAVNGHGTYFSASDAPSLADSLTGALGEIVKTPRAGTAAAAASSNPNVTTTDNFVFSSSYTSYKWIGELIRQEITASGTLNPQNWSARILLDCATTSWTPGKSYKIGNAFKNSGTCYSVKADYTAGNTFDYTSTGVDLLNTTIVNADEYPAPVNGITPSKVPLVPKTDRTIFTNAGSALIDFNWGTLGSMQSSFTETYLTPLLSQFCNSGSTCLSAGDRTSASGKNLVDFVRGVRTNESGYYRSRESVLGDIVSSEAKYVKAPLPNYADTGFSKYKSDQGARAGTVYVGANDGMLHAFDGTTGQENWAFIPSTVVPNLYQLADKNYDTHHQYFVDGSPEVGDVYGPCRPATKKKPNPCTGSEWRTILVSGLNRGGSSYFALDITDPTDPIFLWELTNASIPSMGYSYGNPKITKLKNGTWVVLLTSGYNAPDSKGYLYIRNALDGTAVQSITSVPSSLAGTLQTNTAGDLTHINARALSPDTDNTAIAAYGGDTQGNLWRFDINGDIGASGYDAHKLIILKDSAGKLQPITARPEVATVNGLTMVYVGTGVYLGVNDIGSKDPQSFYGVIDRGDATTLISPRDSNSKFVKQVLTDTTCPAGSTFCTVGQVVRTSTSDSVDWTFNNGWYIDFLGSGERSVTDPSLALGTLLFTTILPSLATTSGPVCGDTTGTAAGGSFLYALDYKNGGAVKGSKEVSGVSLGSIIATRPVPIELSDGTIVTITRGTPPEGKDVETTINKPTINNNSGTGVRRVSWRELTTQ